MEFVIPCLQAAAFDLIGALESKTELMTVDEVSGVFSISLSTVNRMIATRKIPSLLIGGNRKFDPTQLIRWVIKKNPKIMEGRASYPLTSQLPQNVT